MGFNFRARVDFPAPGDPMITIFSIDTTQSKTYSFTEDDNGMRRDDLRLLRNLQKAK
jgi:hypothetical protein